MTDSVLQEIAEIADQMEANARSEGGAGAAIAWHSASHTDAGRVRHINEDAFLDSEEQRLWVVADGMGGQSRGDYASGKVVEELRAFPRQGSVLANLRDMESRLLQLHQSRGLAPHLDSQFRRHLWNSLPSKQPDPGRAALDRAQDRNRDSWPIQ